MGPWRIKRERKKKREKEKLKKIRRKHKTIVTRMQAAPKRNPLLCFQGVHQFCPQVLWIWSRGQKDLPKLQVFSAFFPSNFARRAWISTDKELPAKVSKKGDQSIPLSSPMLINFWQKHMTFIWISPGADIGQHMEAIFIDATNISFLKKSFYSPKLQLVVIFSKADMAIFPGLEILLMTVGDWTFLFFPLSSNQTPNLNIA
jgi:hypothetical protein